MKVASVIIDQDAKALDREFEYLIPDELELKEGERVMVPFGARVIQGFIVEIKDNSSFELTKLKSILRSVDGFPVIKKEMLALMKYMADKLFLKLASILRLFLPSEMRTGKVKELVERYVSLNKEVNSL